MSARWIYRLNNEEFGPLFGEQVIELIQSQILTGSDLIRAENATVWSSLSKVDAFRTELNRDFSENLEVAGSLDDLTFEFAEASSADSEMERANRKARQVVGVGNNPGITAGVDSALNQPKPSAGDGAQVVQEAETDLSELVSSVEDSTQEQSSGQDSTADRRTRTKPAPEQAPQLAAVPRRKAKRKTTTTPEDPLLEEIIRELSERGKPETPSNTSASKQIASPPSIAPSATAASTAPFQSALAPSTATVTTATVTTRPASTSSAASNPSLSAEAAKINSYAQSVAKPTPVRPSRSFQMPEPKTIGIVGGGLVSSLLVVAVCLGWITLPFGTSSGSLPGDAGTVVACYVEFKNFGSAVPAGPEWTEFCSTVEKKIKPVVETSAGLKDNVTEAGRKLMELAALQPKGNPQKLQQIGGELDVLIAGIVGSQ